MNFGRIHYQISRPLKPFSSLSPEAAKPLSPKRPSTQPAQYAWACSSASKGSKKRRSGAPPSGRPGSETSRRTGGASRDGRTPRRRAFPGHPAGLLSDEGLPASPRSRGWRRRYIGPSPDPKASVCPPRKGDRLGSVTSTPKTNYFSLRILSSWRWAISRTPLHATAPAGSSKKKRDCCASPRVDLGSPSSARRGAAPAPPSASPRDTVCSKSGGRTRNPWSLFLPFVRWAF